MMQFIQKSLKLGKIIPKMPTNFTFNTGFHSSPLCGIMMNTNAVLLSKQSSIFLENSRSIFIYRSGDMLWEGVTGAPGRAKKRARGKRRVVRNKVNLNWGRKIGDNILNIKWPGLNTPVASGVDINRFSTGEKDEEYEKALLEMRNRQNKKKISRYVPPLRRGWTSAHFGGLSLGKPVAVVGQNWDGFDSSVLEFKVVCTMNSSKGRYRRFLSCVMVGNGNGLAGYAKAKSVNGKTSMKVAKRKAALRLESYNLREGRTVWHPDYMHERNTKIFIKPRMNGEGLVCHRVIKTMCKLIGIKDMYAKVEGCTKNNQLIARIFTAMLRRQETYQDIANRLSLNVVQNCAESDNYPLVLAEPESGVTKTPDSSEEISFDRLHLDGRVFQVRKREPFYLNLPNRINKRAERHRYRNMAVISRSMKVMEFLADSGHLVRRSLGGGGDGAAAAAASKS